MDELLDCYRPLSQDSKDIECSCYKGAGTHLPADQSDIAFCDVGFSYEDNDFILKKMIFHVPEGTITALVGASGSGKTTVTNLLLRF